MFTRSSGWACLFCLITLCIMAVCWSILWFRFVYAVLESLIALELSQKLVYLYIRICLFVENILIDSMRTKNAAFLLLIVVNNSEVNALLNITLFSNHMITLLKILFTL